jgi:excisionase family DNA binding protein
MLYTPQTRLYGGLFAFWRHILSHICRTACCVGVLLPLLPFIHTIPLDLLFIRCYNLFTLVIFGIKRRIRRIKGGVAMEKQLYSPAEAAEATGLAKSTIIRFLQEGKLAAIRIGKSWRIPAADFKRFVAEGTGEYTGKKPPSRKKKQAGEPQAASGAVVESDSEPEPLPEEAREAIQGVAGVRRVDQPGQAGGDDAKKN